MDRAVEVVRFPKPCPRCGYPLEAVVKMHLTWLECRNRLCPGLVREDEYTEQPFTCARTRR